MSRYALARALAANRVCVLWTWAGVFEGEARFWGPRSEAECALEASVQPLSPFCQKRSTAWLHPIPLFRVVMLYSRRGPALGLFQIVPFNFFASAEFHTHATVPKKLKGTF